MRFWLAALLAVTVLTTTLSPQVASAARGIPGSSDFGLGVSLNLTGPFAIDGIRAASDLQLDWLALDLSWQMIAPKFGAIDWSRLDPILKIAGASQLPTMVSLTNPPDWSLTATGPDPALVSSFVTTLVQRYSKSITAIELFPGANTLKGWGKQPNPQAYMKVWNAVSSALKENKNQVILVGGGLQPVPSGSATPEVIDDLVFLQNLYELGAMKSMPILSVQSSSLTGDPLLAPSKEENRILRHYESVRQVMIKNHHENGLIWITHLKPPAGDILQSDLMSSDPLNQSAWLSQAISQLKSQLFIGVVFAIDINPAPACSTACLSIIQPNGEYHPFFRSFHDSITANHSGSPASRPGRAKVQPLAKSTK